MSERLLTDAEVNSPVDDELLDRVTRGIVAELLDPRGDVDRYRATVRALAQLGRDVMWWVDLVVAAEMLANDQIMREPVGFRSRDD
jgi:hypothetical protein